MNTVDTELHDKIHESMLMEDPRSILDNSRLLLFEKFERMFKQRIKGSIIDMGSGSGYAAIWLALNRSVKIVYALEFSLPAVSKLLPRNINFHGVQETVIPICGSFDNIKIGEKVDFIISFGSLHHSSCLYSTFCSLSSVLKPGGYVIAQEPAMNNQTTNLEYNLKYDCIEKRFGMEIRNGDRNDSFFRDAEYITAAAFNGFDLLHSGNFNHNKANRFSPKLFLKHFLGSLKLRRKSYDQLHELTKGVENKFYVFRKHDEMNIPHLWSPLKKSVYES